MTIWAVVADAARARLFQLEGRAAPLEELKDMIHAEAQLQGREIEADRPGRAFDSVGGGRHAMEPTLDPRREEAERFAREIARQLQSGYEQRRFEGLCLIAPPAFLGMLRAELGTVLHRTVVGELNKDLTHADTARVAAELQALL
ncbi:host attachment protein [uncultured Thiohalocapsa sp.]|uniref:host attachment protein n=1 Tax=uncultured Thiohalocapsa sp. TaxID=768990 RepID=UPI0025D36B06|nr:host attachment protein [uncultured Thiohalocapsa sp.]